MVEKALEASEILKENGIIAGVVNASFVCPIDKDMLLESSGKVSLIVTVEDNVIPGGMGEEINNILINTGVKVVNIGWPDKFIEHGTCEELYIKYKMDSSSIAERIKREFEG